MATVITGGFILVLASIYFLPSLLALERRNKYREAIFVTNLFFGWTVIGWFVALIWAFVK